MEAFFASMIVHLALLLHAVLQNTLILNQAIQQKSTFNIILIFTISSFISATLGIYGFHSIVNYNYTIKYIFTICTIIILLYNAYINIKNAKIKLNDKKNQNIITFIAIIWLNPHVYTDMFVIYSFALAYEPKQYIAIILGFGTIAFVWFYSLSVFSKKLLSIYNSQKLHTRLNYISAIVLVILAIYTAFDSFKHTN